MKKGYILTSKSLLNSDIWSKPPIYLKVWLYLLLNAQYSDYGNLKRGQLFITVQDLVDECTYYAGYRKIAPSRKEIYRILDYLRSPCERVYGEETNDPMIVTTKVTHGMVVTICNYNDYQDPKNYERENEKDTKGNTKGKRKGFEGTNIKNENKRIKEKKDIVSETDTTHKAIIDYLNEKTGRNYKANTDTTRKLLQARIKEGYQLQDFFTVIDNQVARWSNDDKMADYLRPSTLFAKGHFEEYLNNPLPKSIAEKQMVDKNIEIAKQNIEELTAKIDYVSKQIDNTNDFDVRCKLKEKLALHEQALEQNKRYLKKYDGVAYGSI